MTRNSYELQSFSTGAFQTNCYLVVDTTSGADLDADGRRPVTIIDPGHGAFNIINEVLGEEHYVKDIVLTHGHIDHIRDAGHFGVPVYIHELDAPLLTQPQNYSLLPQISELFDIENMQVPEDIRFFGDTITIAGHDFDVHHMPGHSPGSVMLRRPGLIFGGDVLFRGGVGRTDLPGSSAADMMASLKRIEMDFDDGDVVLPGHGPQTSVGEEKRTNPFLHNVR